MSKSDALESTGRLVVRGAITTTHLVGVTSKNSREEIRVTVEWYHERLVCNIRVWFRAPDGEMRPSKKGLAISTERLPDLMAVLSKAMRVASPTWRPAA